jgi:hypothetical protein
MLDAAPPASSSSGIMSSYYDDLAQALRTRIAVIGDRDLRDRDPAAQLARLQEVSERIEALKRQLPADASSQLAHFLERASFDKALAFIEAGQAG